MSGYKYIMFEIGGQRFPVIFPENFVHQQVATLLRHLPGAPQPVSAGFVDALTVLGTSGDSETLRMKSDPYDRVTINSHPYDHGLHSGMERHIEKMLMKKTVELMLDLAAKEAST